MSSRRARLACTCQPAVDVVLVVIGALAGSGTVLTVAAIVMRGWTGVFTGALAGFTLILTYALLTTWSDVVAQRRARVEAKVEPCVVCRTHAPTRGGA